MTRNEKTKKFIIKKTAPIFNKKGYVGTYLSEMTEATGLTKGSIYGNFKDKSEVALEAFRHNYAFQISHLTANINEDDNSLEKLLSFLHNYKKAYKEIFKNGGCAILNTAVDSDCGNSILKKEVKSKILNWSNQISKLLQDAMKSGEIQSVNTKELSHRIIALIQGSLLLAKTLNEPDILLKNITSLEEEIRALKI